MVRVLVCLVLLDAFVCAVVCAVVFVSACFVFFVCMSVFVVPRRFSGEPVPLSELLLLVSVWLCCRLALMGGGRSGPNTGPRLALDEAFACFAENDDEDGVLDADELALVGEDPVVADEDAAPLFEDDELVEFVLAEKKLEADDAAVCFDFLTALNLSLVFLGLLFVGGSGLAGSSALPLLVDFGFGFGFDEEVSCHKSSSSIPSSSL